MIDEKKLIGFINSKEFQMRIVRSQKSVQEILCEFIEEQPKIGGWIPCSERLPECEWGAETGALLYQHKGTGSIEVGYYGRGGKFRDSYFRHYRNSTDGVDSKDVVAWQSLPEAYHE